MIFVACYDSFTPLHALQLSKSPFPWEICIDTFVFHLSGISFPSNTRWQSPNIALISPYPLKDIICGHISNGPADFPGFIAFIAIAISSLVTFSMGPFTMLSFVRDFNYSLYS